MRIFTEVFGGPRNRDLVSVEGNIFDAPPESELYDLDQEAPVSLSFIRYTKCKAFFVFKNKYYFREFFVRNSEDQDEAIKSFRNYFSPIWKK